ncbi:MULTISPECIES: LytR/AlgR family response regulator transcription factor [Aquimarina]|uniref:Response regulator transcription factor n=1 Tax=Aquimarina algiphila TaxID=2047982 RepID=A0A554VI20_9FLAO|nr:MULTISPECIES: LytTR family DNA-binding domain-containing protein [Aquimarina]TSE07280.1 response regulator transcription factor [Aquimarina algiphila]
MIKSLLIEDEVYIRKGLLNLLELLDTEINVLGECESVNEAVILANACKPDLIFLDINLADGTAFDFLEQTKNLEFKIIFITAYEEYALQALKIGAVDYLLKPIEIDELKEAIEKVSNINTKDILKQMDIVQNHLKGEGKKIVLRTQESLQFVILDQLLYCKSDKGYTTFYLSDGRKFLASGSIVEFEKQLPQNVFIRSHQSYLVNRDYIDRYDKKGYLILANETKIPVSTRKREEIISKIF